MGSDFRHSGLSPKLLNYDGFNPLNATGANLHLVLMPTENYGIEMNNNVILFNSTHFTLIYTKLGFNIHCIDKSHIFSPRRAGVLLDVTSTGRRDLPRTGTRILDLRPDETEEEGVVISTELMAFGTITGSLLLPSGSAGA